MNYTKKSFSVAAVPSAQYRDNYERTFGAKDEGDAVSCGAQWSSHVCELPKGHSGEHFSSQLLDEQPFPVRWSP